MTIYCCAEDELSFAVAERLVELCCPEGTEFHILGQKFGGFGYIKKNLPKFLELSRISPVLILTDLDKAECAPSLRTLWFNSAGIVEPIPDNMLFCIAQTEIESWLLADSSGISNFLHISSAKLKTDIESQVVDAKEYLVYLARQSKSSDVRRDLAPKPKSSAATGINYNFRLIDFVKTDWNAKEAAANSVSLRRAIDKLASLYP